jgi:hypothetical protein
MNVAISHLINDTQNGDTHLVTKIYIYLLVFMNHVETKKTIIINHKMKRNWMFFYSHVYPSNTTKHLSCKILKPKCDNKNYKKH